MLCLNAVQAALAALERVTASALVVAADAQARTIGKVSFVEKLCPNVHGLVLIVFSVVNPRGGVGRSLRGGPHCHQRCECRGCPTLGLSMDHARLG